MDGPSCQAEKPIFTILGLTQLHFKPTTDQFQLGADTVPVATIQAANELIDDRCHSPAGALNYVLHPQKLKENLMIEFFCLFFFFF